MNNIYIVFEIGLALLVALVYLADTISEYLPKKVYEFLKDNRDNVVGVYYVYLAYELYKKYKTKTWNGDVPLSPM